MRTRPAARCWWSNGDPQDAPHPTGPPWPAGGLPCQTERVWAPGTAMWVELKRLFPNNKYPPFHHLSLRFLFSRHILVLLLCRHHDIKSNSSYVSTYLVINLILISDFNIKGIHEIKLEDKCTFSKPSFWYFVNTNTWTKILDVQAFVHPWNPGNVGCSPCCWDAVFPHPVPSAVYWCVQHSVLYTASVFSSQQPGESK